MDDYFSHWTWIATGFFFACAALDYALDERERRNAIVGRWTVNLGLVLVNSSIGAMLPFGLLWASIWAQDQGIGLTHLLNMSPWIEAAAWLLTKSLAQYALHRISHRVPPLWALHRVHHSDLAVDSTTGFRHHPLETLWMTFWLSGAAIAFGVNPAILAGCEAAEFAFVIATHSRLRLPEGIERVCRAIFVTPATHALHHSDHAPETNSNYGSVLSIWDRAFGTMITAPQRPGGEFRFGLDRFPEREARDFGLLLLSPFKSGDEPPAPNMNGG